MVPDQTVNGSRPSDKYGYSVISGARIALETLRTACLSELPDEINTRVKSVVFSSSSDHGDAVCFPCPLKEQDLASALKGLEGCAAAALARLRNEDAGKQIHVDVGKVTAFLMSAWLTTLDGMGKTNPKIKSRLPDTDLNQAQSNLYRRFSANLYETRVPGEYYHIHGSLEASTTLQMLGLPPFPAVIPSYDECIATIEGAVKKFTIPELEQLNQQNRQAGIPVLTKDQFNQTAHGQALAKIPPFTVRPLGESTPPVPFPDNAGATRQCRAGVRVLELCRIIAGPTIGRSLAAHGASVLKVTSPRLPDVPFFQLDVNTGKHTTSLHLKDAGDRAIFEELLDSVDVIIDGYRPGALASLGYGAEALAARAAARGGRGIVYVAEDCLGGTDVPGAEWAGRPGWQQIADSVTGVAWEQGRFMGLDEPLIPPFPMSDYGTGILGTVAALTGLYRRATEGGSWVCRTSICQYDVFLLSLGVHAPAVQEALRESHDRDFFELRHSDSVDQVGTRALQSLKRRNPSLFADDMLISAYSESFGGVLKWPKEPLRVDGLQVGFLRPGRPNGSDKPSWDGWEADETLLSQANV